MMNSTADQTRTFCSKEPSRSAINKTSTFDISSSILQDVLYGKRRSTAVYPLMLPASEFIPTPAELCVSRSGLPGHHYGIFSKAWLVEGSRLGPFTGRRVPPTERSTAANSDLMWEVLDEHGQVSHIVDGGQQRPLNWLCLVNSARNDQEQNLQTVQIGQQIYYQVMKTIPPDEELLVWYGSSYHSYMGIPCIAPITGRIHVGTTSREDDCRDDLVKLEPQLSSLVPSGRISCVICKKSFNSKSNLRSHMRTHTLEKPFVCKFCLRAFSQSSTLRNHLRLHTGERPYRCDQCQSAYSQLAGLRAHQKSARHRGPTIAHSRHDA